MHKYFPEKAIIDKFKLMLGYCDTKIHYVIECDNMKYKAEVVQELHGDMFGLYGENNIYIEVGMFFEGSGILSLYYEKYNNEENCGNYFYDEQVTFVHKPTNDKEVDIFIKLFLSKYVYEIIREQNITPIC